MLVSAIRAAAVVATCMLLQLPSSHAQTAAPETAPELTEILVLGDPQE